MPCCAAMTGWRGELWLVHIWPGFSVSLAYTRGTDAFTTIPSIIILHHVIYQALSNVATCRELVMLFKGRWQNLYYYLPKAPRNVLSDATHQCLFSLCSNRG